MALRHGKPNMLSFFKMRRVNFACPHFEYITLSNTSAYNIDTIINWIEVNLNSRYYFEKGISLKSSNEIQYNLTLGFESPAELSIFTIACPLFKT